MSKLTYLIYSFLAFFIEVLDIIIKESIFIGVNNPTLNRNIGKFNLPHIWDRVLLNTPGLNLKRHVQAVWHANSIQTNIPTHLNQPNFPHTLRPTQLLMHIFTGS